MDNTKHGHPTHNMIKYGSEFGIAHRIDVSSVALADPHHDYFGDHHLLANRSNSRIFLHFPNIN
jgi:hypothetical protein